jgi:pre-mRNA-splicing factor CDC5/CEF1
MTDTAQAGSKLEKKLALHLGGYQKRAKMLRGKIVESAEALDKATNSLEAFRVLQLAEQSGLKTRLEHLRDEVGKVNRKEREFQEIYRERRAELERLVGGR